MPTTISGDTGVIFPDATTQSTAVSVTTPFSVNALPATGAELRLPEATVNGVHYVSVKAPDLLAGSVTFTLPTADGTSGQYLRTDGAGQLSFATVPTTSPGGTTGQVQVNNAGAFGAISSGTSGQVLTSNGAGVAPSFATPSGGLSEIDSWYLTTTTGTTDSYSILTAFARSSTYFTKVGTGMTQSSGVFTFPSTGTWEISWQYLGKAQFSGTGIFIEYSTNGGSTFANAGYTQNSQAGGTSEPASMSISTILNVTNTTNNRLRLNCYGISYGGEFNTYITFKKLA